MKCKICGMDINEKNYNFNQWAFLEKNSTDNIIFCPFCGVGKAHLSNDNEIIEVESKLLDEKTLKILDHAAKLELFNGDFYNTAAKMAKSEDVSKLFEALGRIEIFHSKIHLKLGGFTKNPSLSKINYNKHDSDDALLELAKQREKHAIEYYEKYKKEVNSKNLVRVFEALIEVEKDHITLIKE
ncbi:ferritin family protein [Clostridium sp.]|uniref:ferritin family protein n=1 Tax=Clostridium sp. TaxID=1506 RepID=UPI0032169687